MDFIDLSDDHNKIEVDLYESVIGNPKVLSKIRGSFFVPDGESRNKRFYTESLWQKVISNENIKRSLDNGMLGTLLHPTNEKLSHPMYSSHVVKNLWIDGRGKGMGEAYILDTPIGRIVDTFQKSNLVTVYTSSRAFGKYVEGKKHRGMPIVDEDNFVFKTFDLVLDPGFLEAKPNFSEQLESLSECYIENIQESRLSRVQKESRADQILRDLDIVLGK